MPQKLPVRLRRKVRVASAALEMRLPARAKASPDDGLRVPA